MIIGKLNKDNLKKDFDCENELLNFYIRKQARQDINRDLSVCYGLIEISEKRVLGYYTLSGNSIERDEFSKELIKNMPPSYINFPTILLGRLAIDKSEKGNGLGAILLMDALHKCVKISKLLRILAIAVDPINNYAINIYSKYGFILILSTKKMFIPIKTVK